MGKLDRFMNDICYFAFKNKYQLIQESGDVELALRSPTESFLLGRIEEQLGFLPDDELLSLFLIKGTVVHNRSFEIKTKDGAVNKVHLGFSGAGISLDQNYIVVKMKADVLQITPPPKKKKFLDIF